MKPRQYKCRDCGRFSRTKSTGEFRCPLCNSTDVRRIQAGGTPGQKKGNAGSQFVLSRARVGRLKRQEIIDKAKRRGEA